MIGARLNYNMQIMSIESDAYAKHKNLKLAAAEIGMKWQTLYVRLKKQGVAVTGDKSRYGRATDKLGAAAEKLFKELCPQAVDMNELQYQSGFDFLVCGYKVDVKVSNKNPSSAKRPSSLRWSFLFKKQSYVCDFMCCFCIADDGASVEKILLVPNEIFSGLQTVSVTCRGNSKWDEFCIQPDEINAFFAELPNITQQSAQEDSMAPVELAMNEGGTAAESTTQ